MAERTPQRKQRFFDFVLCLALIVLVALGTVYLLSRTTSPSCQGVCEGPCPPSPSSCFQNIQ